MNPGSGPHRFTLAGRRCEGSQRLAEMSIEAAAARDLWLETTCGTCGHRSTTSARHYAARWPGLRLHELHGRMRCTGTGCGIRGGPFTTWGLPPRRG